MSASAPNLRRPGQQTQEPWTQRSPQMLSFVMQNNTIVHLPKLPKPQKATTINHPLFPNPVILTFLGKGDFNTVYSIGDTEYVYKMPSSENHNKPNARINAINNVFEEMKQAQAYGIPYPTCLINPREYTPTKSNEGGFFVMEKLKKNVKVTWKDKPRAEWKEKEIKILNLVKFILQLHFEQKQEIAHDFFPRNVMRAKNGDVKVVDFIVEDKSSNLLQTTAKKIDAWCLGNQEAIDYVTSGIPEEYRPDVLKHYDEFIIDKNKRLKLKTATQNTPPQSPNRNQEPQLTPSKRQRV